MKHSVILNRIYKSSPMSQMSTLLVAAAVQNALARQTADYLNVEAAVTYRQSKGMTVSFKRPQIWMELPITYGH
jgi:hypothetical protein